MPWKEVRRSYEEVPAAACAAGFVAPNATKAGTADAAASRKPARRGV